MGNCLKTQLKSIVQNDTLPYFDSVKVYIKNSKNQYHYNNVKFTAIDNTELKLMSKGYTTFYSDAQCTNVIGKEVSGIDLINAYTDINPSQGSPNYEDAVLIGAHGIKSVELELGFNLVLIKDLEFCTNLEKYTSTSPNETIPGINLSDYNNIKYFAKCTKLQTLSFNWVAYVYGNIDELADAQVANGRTTGTLSIIGLENSGTGGKITCSIPYTNSVTITFDSSQPKGYTLAADA